MQLHNQMIFSKFNLQVKISTIIIVVNIQSYYKALVLVLFENNMLIN